MKPKRTPKPTAKDKAWQKRIEKQVKIEKVELDHSKGQERFNQVLKRTIKSRREHS